MAKKSMDKNYLFIGNMHLGMDDSILSVLGTVASEFNAEVVHLGSRITQDERHMLLRREAKLATWGNQLAEAEKALAVKQREQGKLSDKISAFLKSEKPSEKKAGEYYHAQLALDKKVDALSERIHNLRERCHITIGENSALIAAEGARVDQLNDVFGTVYFLFNKKQTLFGRSCSDMPVGQYMTASCLHPNGDKISSKPITDRALTWFSRFKTGFIVPHPTSVLESKNAEGINNAHTYVTTGGLCETVAPELTTELNQAINMPGAVLVCVDGETGEHHTNRIVFRKDSSGNLMTAVDDLVFKASKVFTPDEIYCVTTDEHVPHHSEAVRAAALNTCKTLLKGSAPVHHVSLSDLCDCAPFSPWLAKVPLDREGIRVKEDFQALKGYLKPFADLPLKSKLVLDSNHHEWLSKYVAQHPELMGVLDWETGEYTQQFTMGYTFLSRQNGNAPIQRIGDQVSRHGDQEGSLKQAYIAFGQYQCGHWHYRQEWGRCYRLPCACDLDPKYLQGRLTGWTQGFTLNAVVKGKTMVTPRVVFSTGDTIRYCYRGKIVRIQK